MKEIVEAAGYRVVSMDILPDEREVLAARMAELADKKSGRADSYHRRNWFFAKRCDAGGDRGYCGAPCARDSGGYAGLQHDHHQRAMLSRAAAGIRKQTLIINLPGSPKAVKESLSYIIDALGHGIEILTGEAGNCAR